VIWTNSTVENQFVAWHSSVLASLPGSGNARCPEQCVSVFALSVSWLWNTLIKCAFLAYISRERVHSPAWEKPGRKTSTFIRHQHHRQQRGEQAVWLLVWVYVCAGVRGNIQFILKEILTAYNVRSTSCPEIASSRVRFPKKRLARGGWVVWGNRHRWY